MISIELVINFSVLLLKGKEPDIISVEENLWIDRYLNEFIVITDFTACKT